MSEGRQDPFVFSVSPQLVANSALAAGVLAGTARLLRPVGWKVVLRFAIDHEVAIDATNAPLVVDALARHRDYRTVGAWLGLGLAFTVRAIIGRSGWAGPWTMTWAGYFLGALLAAWRTPAARGRSGASVALLVPRRIGDYIDRRSVVVPAIGLFAAAVAALAFASSARRNEPWNDGPATVAVVVALAAVVGAASWVALRSVVARPQRSDEPPLVAADDALRAESVHLIAGAGGAVVLLACARSLVTVGTVSDVQFVRWVCPWMGLAALVASWWAWFFVRRRPWGVRRLGGVVGDIREPAEA